MLNDASSLPTAGRCRRAPRRARGSCAARACASRVSSSSSLASSAARWRTSSSWRSMWPSASPSSSRRRLGVDVLAAQLGAHLGARLLGGEQRLELLEGDAEQVLQAHHLAQPLDLGLRVEAVLARRAAPAPRAAGRSPRSSGSCAASCRRSRATSPIRRLRRPWRGGGALRAVIAARRSSHARAARGRCAISARGLGAARGGVAGAQQAHAGADQRRRPRAPTARRACWR